MKHLLLFFLFPLFVYSQYCPSLGPDQYLTCGVNSTTLTADLSQCGTGLNPNQTTNYGVTNIPYSPDSYTNGTQVNLTDDAISAGIPIGFNFCYFGQTYNTFYIGSNNWIGFSAGQTSTWMTTPIPNGGGSAPMNCIMGPWQDINPGIGGTIKYAVYGTAPCRRLVISYYQVPMFSCTNQLYSSQIKIYETTNVIETHILNKPICGSWNSGNAVHGLHNQTGTQAILVQPPVSTTIRNNNQWSTQNEGVRFTPSGPVVTPTLTWYQVGNPNPIGTGPTITVTPPQQGANYTCHFVYPSCNAGWATCNNNGGFGPDTVFVQPGPPNLPPPIINVVNPTCYQSCDGIINVTPVGGSGVQTISWNGGLPNNFTINSLCSGSYSFTIIDANGCTVNGNATLIDPPIITINPINGSDTVCYNSTNNLYDVTSVFPNLGYVWTNTIGNITTGQGTNQINLDVSNVNSGTYVNTLTVIGVNQLGCQSLPQTFTIIDLNILPVITPIGPFCEYDDCINLNATPSGGIFVGMNVLMDQYCPNIGFVGIDQVDYSYNQSGCWFDTSIIVQVYPRPTIVPVSNSVVGDNNLYHEICEGDTIADLFDLTSVSGGFNQWYVFGDTISNNTLSLTWDSDGIFTFQGVRWDNGCVSNPQSFTVSLGLCPNEIFYIPNAFTPNGDEKNNIFKPIITSGIDLFNYSFVIYNRWGEIIWESFNPNMGWDGTYNNKLCQDGIYTWKLRFKSPNTDEVKEFYGNLTIIR